jgi:hypothetical protein
MDARSNSSTIPITILDIRDRLLLEHGLVIHRTIAKERTFERALSICLFDNENEYDCISSVLDGQAHWLVQ